MVNVDHLVSFYQNTKLNNVLSRSYLQMRFELNGKPQLVMQ